MENLLGIGVLVVLGAFVIYKGFFSKKTTVTPVSKPTPVKAVAKAPSKAELSKLTKKELDTKASTDYGIALDGRKTKDAMIKDLQSAVKKQLK